MCKNLQVEVGITSGYKKSRWKKKIRPKDNTNVEPYRTNTKGRLVFIIFRIDEWGKNGTRINVKSGVDIAKIIDFRNTKNLGDDDARANLRGGVNAADIFNFRNAKNLDENSVRASLKGDIGIAGMLNFRGANSSGGSDIDWFGPEKVIANASPVNIEWHLYSFLFDATIEERMIAKLIEI